MDPQTILIMLRQNSLSITSLKEWSTDNTSVFKLLQRSVDRRYLMGFQSETSGFKFLQRKFLSTDEGVIPETSRFLLY